MCLSLCHGLMVHPYHHGWVRVARNLPKYRIGARFSNYLSISPRAHEPHQTGLDFKEGAQFNRARGNDGDARKVFTHTHTHKVQCTRPECARTTIPHVILVAAKTNSPTNCAHGGDADDDGNGGCVNTFGAVRSRAEWRGEWLLKIRTLWRQLQGRCARAHASST